MTTARVTVTTLTVDDGNGIATTVHADENDALARLADEYDDDGSIRATLDDDVSLVEWLTEYGGCVVYLDEHVVVVPVPS